MRSLFQAVRLRVSVMLLAVTMLSISTTSVFAAVPAAGCTAVNGSSGISFLGSSSFNGNFIAGEKISVTLTTDPSVSWSIEFSQAGFLINSGVNMGNGKFNLTVLATSAGTLDITGYDFNPPGVTYSITCTAIPAGAVAPGSEEARPVPPAPETWEGASNSVAENYDGRINATKADRYAVYCKSGELQVWDGVGGQKVGRITYTQIAELANPVSLAIGNNVFLGRSNNELAVVIPNVFEKFGIVLDKCTGGGYEVRR